MIINTGMRTDIPAFYSKWLLNRIKEGYVYVRNPYYKHQVTRYSLNPSVVDCLAFCTKNPHPLIPHLKELEKYKQFWFVTITPYGKDIEPNVPNKRQIIADFKVLSSYLGKNSVALRYDPILINEKFDVNMHIKCFEKLLSELKGYTNDCTISFIDMYDKVRKNAPDIRPPTEEEQIQIAKAFLKDYGLDITGCMSKEIVQKAINSELKPTRNTSKRPTCNCLMGNDIGAYNTCMHLCKYCYANANQEMVKQNVKKHNPNSPFLIGEVEKEDKITQAIQKSWIEKDNQISLF